MKRTTKVFGTVLLTGGLLLAGCSDDDSESSEPTETVTPSEDESTDEGTEATEEESDQSSASGAGVEDRDAEALVEQTVALPEASDDQATVGIQSLTVEGETMVLRLVITPDFASTSGSDTVMLGEALDTGSQFFGVNLRLLDRANLKEYSVIHTNSAWWASGSTEVSALNGEPMYAFAVFAAPEDDIDTVDVRIHEQWPEFTDVPITRCPCEPARLRPSRSASSSWCRPQRRPPAPRSRSPCRCRTSTPTPPRRCWPG